MTKEETLSYLKAYLDGDTAIGNIISLRSVLESAIKYLEPSLPSNLDEAAQKVEDYYDVGEEHGYLCCHRGDIKNVFKSGAEWMAGQGVTLESRVYKDEYATKPPFYYVATENSDDLPLVGDKVVVQIREK